MKNMSNRNGAVDNGALDLDIINEYLMEKTIPTKVLPGPPPPPMDQEMQTVNAPSRSRCSAPVLVARGTATQPKYNPMPNAHTDGMAQMRTMQNFKGMSHRRGQGSSAPQCVTLPTGTEHLEQFLEKPELVVVEQPKERGMRFRYECEGRSAGSILGASSTDVNKSLPAVEIQGPIDNIKKVTVTVSLVTRDIPHRPHPHCLVGKDCSDGICVIHINPHSSRRHSFANLGIQCVRRKELDQSLERRRKKNIDPFNTGHSKSIEDIDMNVVRLCFQCELERKDGDRIQLAPLVTNPIYDKKATTTAELKINRLNVVRGPCEGKTEIYMLCDKVQKDDIEIIFSHEDWEAKAEFAQTDVHRQIAIVFKSPPFRDIQICKEVEVNVCLRRLSDRMDSEAVKFTYLPKNTDPYGLKRKRENKSDIAHFTESYSGPAFIPPATTNQEQIVNEPNPPQQKSDIQHFTESYSVPQVFIPTVPTSQEQIANEPNPPQQFDQCYAIPERNVPKIQMAMPVQDEAVLLPPQEMEDAPYEQYIQEDRCITMDPEMLDLSLLETFFRTLTDPSFHDIDAQVNPEVNQQMMNMSSINDAHFSQMVTENQTYPTDLENVDGLFYPVKSEDGENL